MKEPQFATDVAIAKFFAFATLGVALCGVVTLAVLA